MYFGYQPVVILFANIFSHSIGCFFVDSFLCCAKAFKLVKSHLFIFAFVSFTLGDCPKKISLQLMSKRVLPILCCHVLTFRSLHQFEFIFLYGVRECPNFIVLHVALWLSQDHLLKDYLFSIVYSYLLYHRLTVICGFISGLFGPVVYVSFFVPIPCCFDYCSFIV